MNSETGGAASGIYEQVYETTNDRWSKWYLLRDGVVVSIHKTRAEAEAAAGQEPSPEPEPPTTPEPPHVPTQRPPAPPTGPAGPTAGRSVGSGPRSEIQEPIYLARVTQAIGDYGVGDVVEVSRAPASWLVAGTKDPGWVVTSLGRRGQHLSEACARECLQTVRNPAGRPYRVETQEARCRRYGYVRHTNTRLQMAS
jgi:hypothetical protein